MLATTECIKLWPKVPTALTTGINKKMMEAIAKEVDIGVREVAKKYAKSVKKISIEDLQSIHKSEWVELMADGPVKIVKI
jgi:arsenate reductase-like glutaredoxin family protein